MAAHYPDISWDKQHIDILCARFVQQPERFDVVVASNLFGTAGAGLLSLLIAGLAPSRDQPAPTVEQYMPCLVGAG